VWYLTRFHAIHALMQAVDGMYKTTEGCSGGNALLHLFIAQFHGTYHNNLHMEIVHLTLAAVRTLRVLNAACIHTRRTDCFSSHSHSSHSRSLSRRHTFAAY
jgi:hypothetical protein